MFRLDSEKKKRGEVITIIIIVFFLYHLITNYFLCSFVVRQNSMTPEFTSGSRVLSTPIYRSSSLKRGSLVFIENEEKYDGFYAVCTNLNDNIGSIVRANKRRWEIEECFRIMKTDFEARPVYLNRKDRILAHFITCFISLIVYRYLEKKLNNKYTIDQILPTLQEMDFIKYEGKGYQPIYTRTELTDALHDAFGFCTSKQIVPIKKMRNIFSQTKK